MKIKIIAAGQRRRRRYAGSRIPLPAGRRGPSWVRAPHRLRQEERIQGYFVDTETAVSLP
jgi:hypothetical protein